MKLLKIPLDFPIAQFLVRLSRSPVALVCLSTSTCPHRAAGPGARALPGGDCVKAEIKALPPVPRGAPWGQNGAAAWRLTGSPRERHSTTSPTLDSLQCLPREYPSSGCGNPAFLPSRICDRVCLSGCLWVSVPDIVLFILETHLLI